MPHFKILTLEKNKFFGQIKDRVLFNEMDVTEGFPKVGCVSCPKERTNVIYHDNS